MAGLSKAARDTITFLVGLIGILHEARFVQEPRPYLLAVFATMAGLPAFFHRDEKEQKKEA